MPKKLQAAKDEIQETGNSEEAIMDSYTGRYAFPSSRIITISKEGIQLKAQLTGQNALRMFPKSDKIF